MEYNIGIIGFKGISRCCTGERNLYKGFSWKKAGIETC